MGVHDGHRERLKNRFLAEGLANFDDHNILELLLFYSIPRMDTNEIAHNLLNEYKTLSGVFDAPVEQLCKVKGVSMHTATLIKLIPALMDAYHKDKTKKVEVVNSSQIASDYFSKRFYGKNNEEVQVLLLDDRKRIIKCETLSEGSVNSTDIVIRKLITIVVNSNATAIVIAHNHPTGSPLPSKSDITATEKIYNAMKLINVDLCDHVIVSERTAISMADSGYFEIFKE